VAAPTVSVVMNCLNGERYLREAIDSVYAQTYADWEIIFWDNASTDRSGEIAQSYDARMRYFRGASTLPLGAARNKALQQARGRFIAFLDCDDVWLPGKLESQTALFNDPEVDLVYSDAIYFNPSGRAQRLYERHPYFVGRCFAQLLVHYCLSLVTVVIRQQALARQPYWFDERFHVSEEAELFLRLAYAGKVAMVDRPLAKYRVHSDSWTMRHPELFEKEREMMLERFAEVIPQFETAFRSEIAQLRARHAFSAAKRLWISGQAVAARAMLKPYLGGLRAALLYLLTFSPRAVGQFLERQWNVPPQ
jgi:glycosyltransferase involved in cell wall biosynthesis